MEDNEGENEPLRELYLVLILRLVWDKSKRIEWYEGMIWADTLKNELGKMRS